VVGAWVSISQIHISFASFPIMRENTTAKENRILTRIPFFLDINMAGRKFLSGKDSGENQYIEEKLKGMEADKNFVLFVLAWYGVDPYAIVPFGQISEAYKRRIKRRVQRREKEGWPQVYGDIRREWREWKKIKLIKTLFKQEPLTPRPRGGQKDIDSRKVCHVLRIYFKRLTGRFQMELIAWILGIESDSLAQEFSRYGKERLPSGITILSVDEKGKATLREKAFSPKEEYEMLEKYYMANKEKIEKRLGKGICVSY